MLFQHKYSKNIVVVNDDDMIKIYRCDDKYKRVDAEWNESDHPRSQNGQFGSGGGSSGVFKEMAKSVKEDISLAIMTQDAYGKETPYMDAWEEAGRDIDDFDEKGIEKVLSENSNINLKMQRIDPQSIENKGRSTSRQFVEKYKGMLSESEAPPILVKKNKDGNYQIVEGGHRLQAAKESGTKEINIVDVTDILKTPPSELFKK